MYSSVIQRDVSILLKTIHDASLPLRYTRTHGWALTVGLNYEGPLKLRFFPINMYWHYCTIHHVSSPRMIWKTGFKVTCRFSTAQGSVLPNTHMYTHTRVISFWNAFLSDPYAGSFRGPSLVFLYPKGFFLPLWMRTKVRSFTITKFTF